MSKQCPYCQTESLFHFRSRDYNRKITQATFDHYRCPRCELIFIDPVPANLGDYYPDTYHFIPTSAAYLEAGSEPERYKIDLVRRFVRAGRLLEIGPAYGSFTYLAKKAGFEVEAIEMSKRCCTFLNEVVGVQATQSNDPIQALQNAPSYDVIALWHVIEHLPNPWVTLDAICSSLKPGGIVVLAAPNPNAFQFHVMGRYWPHVDAPRHLTMIPMALLAEKMGALGMTPELATTTDPGSIGWNRFGWEFFFANLASQRHINRLLRLVGRGVSLLLAPLERREGHGSAYTMIFRKEA